MKGVVTHQDQEEDPKKKKKKVTRLGSNTSSNEVSGNYIAHVSVGR